ncbi:MAG: Cys-Xaa-Xaa-Xaa repeat radical SAM target protein [Bacteroidaceae bacterium]|nr:Cys-Xaa-Xaa-Xaa repeat radical SAM target protein [Bacteroidaceae bacterium]
MEKNNKEELSSRRDFFKSAAKGILPILGGIVLVNASAVAKAAETPMGCSYTCSGTCQGTCGGTCRNGCQSTCYHGCYSHCTKMLR